METQVHTQDVDTPVPQLAFNLSHTQAAELGSPNVLAVIESELRRQEDAIAKREGDSLRARWYSGRYLLSLRKGKQLPKGVRDLLKKLKGDYSVHPSEITARMKFASKFGSEDQLATAVSTLKSWHNIKQHCLTTKSRGENPKKSNLQRALDIILDCDTLTENDLKLIPRLREGVDALERRAVDPEAPAKSAGSIKKTFSYAGETAHLLRGGGKYGQEIIDEHLQATIDEVCEADNITLPAMNPTPLRRFESLFLQHFDELRDGLELIDQRQCADEAAKLAIRDLVDVSCPESSSQAA